MHRVKCFLKKLFTPVTIMLIPHTSRTPYRLRASYISLFAVAALSLMGSIYVFKISKDAFLYQPTKAKLDYYTNQILDLQSTIYSLNKAKKEFNHLFSLNSKEDVLDNMNFSDSGSIDMEALRREINKTMDSVAEIRDYLSEARDLYRATPKGWPLGDGWISSSYGKRVHPIRGGEDFHTGIDISSRPGVPVLATADGIVSFAGRSGANGNLVAVEHGFGYQTFYAHNKKIIVKIGQVVKRGDVISYVGSTGSSTGPHLHYEIWKDGRNMNPNAYLKGSG